MRTPSMATTSGADGLISRQRGHNNRRKPDEVRTEALSIISKRHADFGPTLAAEKLRELHGICLGRETVRVWMIEAGLSCEREKRCARAHQPQYRRDCVGELIQLDGSEHRWFEERGPVCTLLAYIDDATSRLMPLRFVESESTFAISPPPRAISKPTASRWPSTLTSIRCSASTVMAAAALATAWPSSAVRCTP